MPRLIASSTTEHRATPPMSYERVLTTLRCTLAQQDGAAMAPNHTKAEMESCTAEAWISTNAC
eukprot:6179120-Pleurochrysis_carterae.AAC.5